MSDDDAAVLDPRAGFLRTDRAVLSAVAAAENAGAQVQTATPVDALHEDPHGVRVVSGSSSWTFERRPRKSAAEPAPHDGAVAEEQTPSASGPLTVADVLTLPVMAVGLPQVVAASPSWTGRFAGSTYRAATIAMLPRDT